MPSGRATPASLLDLLEVLRSTARPIAQSRLLNTADRDVAAVLSAAQPPEREEVLSLMGPAKRRRIEEELERMTHVRLPPETIDRLARHLAAHLAADKPLGPGSRYFKPVSRSD
jgi:hypothetical protein